MQLTGRAKSIIIDQVQEGIEIAYMQDKSLIIIIKGTKSMKELIEQI